MKRKILVVGIILLVFIGLILGLYVANFSKNTFSLDEKYYTSSSYNELDVEKYNELIENKESFAIFIYQPLCSTSYDFNKVLMEFASNYRISFYKMSFANMKKTNLNDRVKYYPSLVIFNEGEVVDFLDANSDEDTNYYKSVDGFKKWFSSYVKIKKVNNGNNSDDIEKEEVIDANQKIDAKLPNLKYNKNKVNIYFFWGNGCPHCEEEFKFFKSIETEYGDYFTLNTFEVWYDEDNAKILDEFSSKMNDEVTGVPYTIIGNKTFKGFGTSREKDFLDAIKTQYKNSYDVYFDNK